MPYLKRQGGALINVGSEVSEAYTPLLGMYVTTKHAVKGYTDCLRVEIEELDKAPVAITLIQPGATDTPFPQHAQNVTGKEPKIPDPQDDPRHVAEAILAACETPTREKKVSVSASLNATLAKVAGGVADFLSGKKAPDSTTTSPRGTRRARSINRARPWGWRDRPEAGAVRNGSKAGWRGVVDHVQNAFVRFDVFRSKIGSCDHARCE